MGTAVHKLKPSPLAKHLGVVNHVALIHSIGRGTHKAWAQLIVYHCGSHKWSHDHLNIMVHEFLSLSHELLCPFGPSFGPPPSLGYLAVASAQAMQNGCCRCNRNGGGGATAAMGCGACGKGRFIRQLPRGFKRPGQERQLVQVGAS